MVVQGQSTHDLELKLAEMRQELAKAKAREGAAKRAAARAGEIEFKVDADEGATIRLPKLKSLDREGKPVSDYGNVTVYGGTNRFDAWTTLGFTDDGWEIRASIKIILKPPSVTV